MNEEIGSKYREKDRENTGNLFVDIESDVQQIKTVKVLTSCVKIVC